MSYRGDFPQCSSVVDGAHQMHSAAGEVARSLRVDGLAGPAEAYQLIGYLGSLTSTAQELMSTVVGLLHDMEAKGVLTVEEGPFADEPEAAMAVVVDAVSRASASTAHAKTELERAHIAAADIGATRSPVTAKER